MNSSKSERMEKLFFEWFKLQPQKNNQNKTYKESTINAAIRLLRDGLQKLKVPGYEVVNCFNITNVNTFENLYQDCYSAAKKYDDKEGMRDFRNGLEFYLEFLKEQSFGKPILEILKAYKNNFAQIDAEERYKWEAIKHYKDNWDIDAPDFADMVERAFAKTFNLLAAGQYYARKMLVGISKEHPEDVRNLFKMLYDESLSLENRVDAFRSGFDVFVKKQGKNHYQDLHAISVYLTFEYPEKYYIYKYGVWTGFLKNIDESIPSTKGKHETFKVENSNKICDEILNLVREDIELCSMSASRLDNNCYDDPNCRMLAFDIMFYGSNYKLNELEGWWPSLEEYDPSLSKDDWLEILNDSELTHPAVMAMFNMMLEQGGQSSCAKLAEIYGNVHNYYNKLGSSYGERVLKKYNLPLLDDNGVKRYFVVPFVGKDITEDGKVHFCWKLRPELKAALEELDLLPVEVKVMQTNINKNTILYGPPGTGKTYNTARYAVAIIENKNLVDLDGIPYNEIIKKYNEYKAQGRVEFTTFHQSYGYEEFIEGIKPVLSESNEVQYKVESGLFKSFCERVGGKRSFNEAWNVLIEAAREGNNCYTFTRRTGTKISAELRDEESFIVKWSGNTQSQSVLGKANIDKQWQNDDYNVRESLSGGTKWLFDANQAVIDELVSNFELKSKSKDSENSSANYVFIIDEINRGNISKIFGELITLIEPTKRLDHEEAVKVKLPYSQKLFGVPDNVYILGTMNTADRSIAMLDTALRRRFDFVEMMPDAEILKGIDVEGIDISKMLEVMNKRIEVLFDREHTIGHAYFIGLKDNNDIETLANIFKNKVIPLLQEYFYEDYEKIRLVLADNQSEDEAKQFIKIEDVKIKDLFGKNDIDILDDPKKYYINDVAFKNKDAYIKIYSK